MDALLNDCELKLIVLPEVMSLSVPMVPSVAVAIAPLPELNVSAPLATNPPIEIVVKLVSVERVRLWQ